MATTKKKTPTTSKRTATKPPASKSLAADTDMADDTDEAMAQDDTAAPVAVQGVTRPIDGVGDGTKYAKKDLIDRVIARSGVKPRYVRDVTDALLTELGEMAESADTIQAQPLGNLKVQRRRDLEDGEIIILKLRRKTRAQDGDEALAAAAE